MSLLLDLLGFFTQQSTPGTISLSGIVSAEAFGTARITDDAAAGNVGPLTRIGGGRVMRPVFGTASSASPVRGTRRNTVR